MAAFPERSGRRLRTFLAEEYARRDQGDRAAEMLWANFVDRPGLPTYEELHALTSPAGTWPGWRTRAPAVLTDEARPPKDGRAAALTWTRRDGSELVRVYLWEKDPEAAWSSAGEVGCSQDLWMQLAQGCEAERRPDGPDGPEHRVPPVRRRHPRHPQTEAESDEASRQGAMAMRGSPATRRTG